MFLSHPSQGRAPRLTNDPSVVRKRWSVPPFPTFAIHRSAHRRAIRKPRGMRLLLTHRPTANRTRALKKRARDEFTCLPARRSPKNKIGGAVRELSSHLPPVCCVAFVRIYSHAKIPSSRFDRARLGAVVCGPDVAIPLDRHRHYLCGGVAGDGARRRAVRRGPVRWRTVNRAIDGDSVFAAAAPPRAAALTQHCGFGFRPAASA